MPAIVWGVYRQGKVDLLETPAGLREGRVRVILIEEEREKPPARYLTFGKYHSGTLSTPEDFQEAEWQGEQEFDGRYGQ